MGSLGLLPLSTLSFQSEFQNLNTDLMEVMYVNEILPFRRETLLQVELLGLPVPRLKCI